WSPGAGPRAFGKRRRECGPHVVLSCVDVAPSRSEFRDALTMRAEPLRQRARTKIVATVGPASRSREMLAALVDAGVDVFRLNMAHGDRREHAQAVADIRQVSREAGRPVGILVDLAGP